MSNLTKQLAEFQANSALKATAHRLATGEATIAEIRASGVMQSALKVGDALPQVLLTDALGQLVSLAELNAKGPLVIVFYRGGWCPYCNLQLREWQRRLPDVKALGAQLVAISPQKPDGSLSTTEKNALEFAVLSDSSLEAAKAFGLAFTIPQEMVSIYIDIGNDLPEVNGNGQWVLPVPATYVVGADGKVKQAHVEADHRLRAEPGDVLDALRRAS